MTPAQIHASKPDTGSHANGVVGSASSIRHNRGWALLGLLLVVFAPLAWPFVRAHLQALAVLDQVAGQPVPGIVARLATTPTQTQDLSFTIQDVAGHTQQVRARLYLPAGNANAPGLVVFHGVHHLGIDEPRLVAFASAMASCGIRVLTPELPGIKDYQIGLESVHTIGESVKWFAAQSGGKPVGVLGLSFSGGLALVAATDAHYQGTFKFVFAVGSQYGMDNVARYYTTGRDTRPDGSVEVLAAHEYGPLVLEYEHLEDFVPIDDLPPIRTVLRARLYEDKAAEAAASLRLNERQKLETLELIDATLPATRAKIDAMVARHVAELPGISPRDRLRTLTVPVYLLHGEGDNIIPSAETLWMATELPPSDLKAVLVSPILSHIDFTSQAPGVMDQWQLIHFFALIVRATESH
jgi:acetyl esterase/lipase